MAKPVVRSRLGRGLSALISAGEETVESQGPAAATPAQTIRDGTNTPPEGHATRTPRRSIAAKREQHSKEEKDETFRKPHWHVSRQRRLRSCAWRSS